MGHIRLGRLPKLRPWTGVFSALDSADLDVAELAKATAVAAQQQFKTLEGNEAINYCFWVLVRIAAAAKRKDLSGELERLGANSNNVTSGLTFIHEVSRAVEKELKQRGQANVFVRMAALSLRDILTANIVERSQTLFGTSFKDVESACRSFSSPKPFGQITKEFYASFTSRSLLFLVDKELSNYVGPGKSISSPDQALELHSAVKRYCLETAKIVEEFAAGWFSKNNWQTDYNISEDTTQGFTSYALQKIQMDLREGQK